MGKSLVTAPTIEPVTLEEIKLHLRVEHTDDDSRISSLLIAAREAIEKELDTALINQTWDFTYDCFENSMDIPIAPLSSVTSVKYIDTDGAEQTLSSSVYEEVTNQLKGSIRLAYDQEWPDVQDHEDTVTIRAVVGYGDGWGEIPEPLKQAIKLLVAHYYKNAEDTVTGLSIDTLPKGYDWILNKYRWSFL